MKVYGGLTFNEERKQVRTIVAARSQKEAASLVGCKPRHFRYYWVQTGNRTEIDTAMSAPGKVFRADDLFGANFKAEDSPLDNAT